MGRPEEDRADTREALRRVGGEEAHGTIAASLIAHAFVGKRIGDRSGRGLC